MLSRLFAYGWLSAYRRPWPFLIVLIVFPLCLVLWLTYRSSLSLTRQQALHNLHTIARLASEIVDQTLQETLRFEELLAAQPEFVKALKRGDRVSLTQRIYEILPFSLRVDAVIVLTTKGEILATSPNALESVGLFVTTDEPFHRMQKNGWQPYISGVYLRAGPQIEKVVSVIIPIRDDESVIGLLQVQHRVETVKSWLQKIRLEPEGFLYVVDHQNQLVVYPYQILPGRPKRVDDWPPVAHPLFAEGATLLFRDPKTNHRSLAGLHPIGTTGWRVVATQPEQAALETLQRMFRSLLLVMLFLCAFMAMVSWRWARVHACSLELLRRNTLLLKQLQQRRILKRNE